MATHEPMVYEEPNPRRGLREFIATTADGETIARFEIAADWCVEDRDVGYLFDLLDAVPPSRRKRARRKGRASGRPSLSLVRGGESA